MLCRRICVALLIHSALPLQGPVWRHPGSVPNLQIGLSLCGFRLRHNDVTCTFVFFARRFHVCTYIEFIWLNRCKFPSCIMSCCISSWWYSQSVRRDSLWLLRRGFDPWPSHTKKYNFKATLLLCHPLSNQPSTWMPFALQFAALTPKGNRW